MIDQKLSKWASSFIFLYVLIKIGFITLSMTKYIVCLLFLLMNQHVGRSSGLFLRWCNCLELSTFSVKRIVSVLILNDFSISHRASSCGCIFDRLPFKLVFVFTRGVSQLNQWKSIITLCTYLLCNTYSDWLLWSYKNMVVFWWDISAINVFLITNS